MNIAIRNGYWFTLSWRYNDRTSFSIQGMGPTLIFFIGLFNCSCHCFCCYFLFLLLSGSCWFDYYGRGWWGGGTYPFQFLWMISCYCFYPTRWMVLLRKYHGSDDTHAGCWVIIVWLLGGVRYVLNFIRNNHYFNYPFFLVFGFLVWYMYKYK